MKPTSKITLVLAGLLLLGAGCFGPSPSKNPPVTPPVACTDDARQCPDGSYVGRTGPNCEFAPCPSSATPPPAPSPLPPPSPTACKDFCGDGMCYQPGAMCEGADCPCIESYSSCPQDCPQDYRKIPPAENCPDVCAAVCGGQPEPEVPPGCPMPMCYCPPQPQ